MATILQFRRPDRRAPASDNRRRASQGERQSAEIIIFPGVRIERQAAGRAEAGPIALEHAGRPVHAE